MTIVPINEGPNVANFAKRGRVTKRLSDPMNKEEEGKIKVVTDKRSEEEVCENGRRANS